MMRHKLWSLVLLMSIGFSAAKAAENPSLILGHGDAKTVSYVQVTAADTTGAALFFPASQMTTCKECRITSVSIALQNASAADGIRVFISSSMDAKPLYEQRFTSKAGWNTFVLDEPFAIDGQALYVGYETTGTRMLCYCTALTKGEEWVRKNNSGWKPYTDIYSASMYISVEGDNLPRNNVSLGHVVMPRYAKTGQPITYSGEFVNLGLDRVEDLTFSFMVDGQEMATETVGGLAVNSREKGSFSFSGFSFLKERESKVSIAVKAVNGAADADTTDNVSRTVSVLCRDSFVRRNVLMEVFSTELCTGCPAGHKTIELAMGGKPDVIEVDHHAGFYTDPFTVDASVEYEWFFKPYRLFAPAVMIDRTADVDNYPDIFADSVAVFGPSLSSLNTWYDAAANTPAVFSLTVVPELERQGGRLSLSVSGEQLLPLDGGEDMRLTVFLTEDSLYTEGQRGVSEGYYHRHSLRQCVSDTWGDSISLEDGRFRMDYETVLSEDWNPDHLAVVAFVSKRDTADRTACEVLNSCEVKLGDSQTAVRSVRTSRRAVSRASLCLLDGTLRLPLDCRSLRIYDMSGCLLYQLSPDCPQVEVRRGLYLLKVEDGNDSGSTQGGN